MSIDLLPEFVRAHYEVHEWKHACAILKEDFPVEWSELCAVISGFRLRKSWIAVAGGRKSKVAESFDHALGAWGWKEKSFDTQVVVDQQSHDSPTHKVDCFKNRVALEIEWNNKDPFFDRDLNNFRLLFDLRVVSVGIIITRCDELQDIFDRLGRGSSYGSSTTHMSKLLPRIHGGGGGGCPLLVLGIKKIPLRGGLRACKKRLTISGQAFTANSGRSWPIRPGNFKTGPAKWRRNTSACRATRR